MGEVIHTILEHRLVVLSLYLTHVRCRYVVAGETLKRTLEDV